MHEPNTTNNRMEILAAIEALNLVEERSEIVIHSDSKYLINAARKWIAGWRRLGWRTKIGSPVKNIDLWQMLSAGDRKAFKRGVSIAIWLYCRPMAHGPLSESMATGDP